MKPIYLLLLPLFLTSCLTEVEMRQKLVDQFNTTEIKNLPNGANYYVVKTKDGCIWYASTDASTETIRTYKMFDSEKECDCQIKKAEKE